MPPGPIPANAFALQPDQSQRRERFRVVSDRMRPVSLAREQTLPVPNALTPLFPEGSLRRGTTIRVHGPGATSIGLALAGPATQAGSWLAIVGDQARSVGLVAGRELGLALERVVVLPTPPEQWGATMAAVVGALDVVLVASRHRVSVRDVRQLQSRARERGSVLIAVTLGWPEAVDLEISLTADRWQGLGLGHGHLQAREVHLVTSGRRDLSRPRQLVLRLPAVAAVPAQAGDAAVVPAPHAAHG